MRQRKSLLVLFVLTVACLGVATTVWAGERTATRSIDIGEPTEAREIYRRIGEAFGIAVLFDPGLPSCRTQVDLQDVSLEQALERLALACTHFHRDIDEHAIIIAEDTPQNRREYEELQIRVFHLENLPVQDADKVLRSLIEARRLAVDEHRDQLILRDTGEKTEVASLLLQTIDQPEQEIEVEIEAFEPRPGLADALQDLAAAGGSSSRLTPAALARLRRDGLLAPTYLTRLSLIGDRPAQIDSGFGTDWRISVRLTGEVHPSSNEVSLDLRIDRSATGSDTLYRTEQQFRLTAGSTYLAGLVPTGERPGESAQPLFALTPHILHNGAPDPTLPSTIRVGSETRISLHPSDSGGR